VNIAVFMDYGKSEDNMNSNLSEGLKKALEAALKLEDKGYSYYTDIAQKAKNPLTKNLFATLAEQELQHKKRINELYKESSVDIPEITLTEELLENTVKQVFENFSNEEKNSWNIDNEDAYKYAMKLERDSLKMYREFAEKSINPAESNFFKALANEENAHLNALQNVYNYLNNTRDWFASNEAKTWNWMVT